MTSDATNVGSLPQARSCAVLSHVGGLHARPSIKLTQLAKRFESSVWLALGEHGPWTDAKSIARVMALKIPHMATLHFMAQGDDADEAVMTLTTLVESDFGDDGGNGR